MKIRSYKLSLLDMGAFTLAGYSVAGEESVIVAPELDCAFDIGKCPREALAVNHVLLSHGHMDHAAGVPYYFAQRHFQGAGTGTVVAPAEMVKPLQALMVAWGRVEGHSPAYHPHRFVGIRAGEDYQIRRGLVARAFAVRHSNPAVGYAVVEVRQKLKSEYAGLTGPQIVELKNSGTQITDRVEYPLVAYAGDTAKANFSELPHVAGARVLLLECTFFDPDHLRRARAGRHLHVADLPFVLEGMSNERIVIIHTTRRTNMAEARKILRKSLTKDILDRVSFLMSRKYIEED
ncbi:MAG TPA: MBL fold metallo-hydrolase [Phycisphaerae bacterium]|nr:MBL fold metallo-hydrolase [Phycisphaerae bacterium]